MTENEAQTERPERCPQCGSTDSTIIGYRCDFRLSGNMKHSWHSRVSEAKPHAAGSGPEEHEHERFQPVADRETPLVSQANGGLDTDARDAQHRTGIQLGPSCSCGQWPHKDGCWLLTVAARTQTVRAPETAEQFWNTWNVGKKRGKEYVVKPFTVQLSRVFEFAEAYAAERVAALNQRIKELEAQILASAPGARAREEELRDRLLTTERRAEADLAEAHREIERLNGLLLNGGSGKLS